MIKNYLASYTTADSLVFLTVCRSSSVKERIQPLGLPLSRLEEVSNIRNKVVFCFIKTKTTTEAGLYGIVLLPFLYMGYKTPEEKEEKARQLFTQIDELKKELHALFSPETEAPAGFSLNDEVLQVVKEAGVNGIDPKRLLSILKNKYPKYPIDRTKVAGALTYLKNTKKLLTQIGRGVYKITEEEKALS